MSRPLLKFTGGWTKLFTLARSLERCRACDSTDLADSLRHPPERIPFQTRRTYEEH